MGSSQHLPRIMHAWERTCNFIILKRICVKCFLLNASLTNYICSQLQTTVPCRAVR